MNWDIEQVIDNRVPIGISNRGLELFLKNTYLRTKLYRRIPRGSRMWKSNESCCDFFAHTYTVPLSWHISHIIIKFLTHNNWPLLSLQFTLCSVKYEEWIAISPTCWDSLAWSTGGTPWWWGYTRYDTHCYIVIANRCTLWLSLASSSSHCISNPSSYIYISALYSVLRCRTAYGAVAPHLHPIYIRSG